MHASLRKNYMLCFAPKASKNVHFAKPNKTKITFSETRRRQKADGLGGGPEDTLPPPLRLIGGWGHGMLFILRERLEICRKALLNPAVTGVFFKTRVTGGAIYCPPRISGTIIASELIQTAVDSPVKFIDKI